MRYVSIDIETTGLDLQRSHVLEVAAVFDDGMSDVDDLPKFEAVIEWESFKHAEPYAMSMPTNVDLLNMIKTGKGCVKLQMAHFGWNNFMEELRRSTGVSRLTAAGKNLASFDFPILSNEANGFDTSFFRHRILDLGSLYAPDFPSLKDRLPSLDEVRELIGLNGDGAHRAINDALDVVKAIRRKLG